MKEEKLIEIIREAVENEGFAFYAGEEHNINGMVRVWPAAWLAPPVVSEKAGREEGEITYRVTLHLMSLNAKPTGKGILFISEKKALNVLRSLASASEVCSVSGLMIKPEFQSLTAHGEVTTTLSGEIKMWYYI